jgi:hypothetical protein
LKGYPEAHVTVDFRNVVKPLSGVYFQDFCRFLRRVEIVKNLVI